MSKSFKLAGFAAASIFAATATAHAGAFALREQSAEAMGSAFAGVAAGNGGLSSMFLESGHADQDERHAVFDHCFGH